MVLREIVNLISFKVDESQLKNAEKVTRRFANDLEQIGRRMTLFLTAPIIGMGAFAVKTAGQLEQMGVSFETIIGNAERADQLIRELIMFTAKTPFQLPEIRESAQMLLGMGFAVENIIPTLQMLGDVAGGLGQPIRRIALNFGQVKTQSRLTGRELRDFAVIGVPILDELSSVTGKTTAQLRKMIEEGQIGFDLVQQAFENMTSESGNFYRLTEKLSKTILGLLTTLIDSFKLFFAAIGTTVVRMLKLDKLMEKAINTLNDWTESWEYLNKDIKRFWIILIAILALIGPLLLGFSQLIKMGLALRSMLLVLAGGFTKAGTAALLFQTKMLLLPIAIISAIALLILIIEDLYVWIKGGQSVIGDLIGTWDSFTGKFTKGIKLIFDDFRQLFNIIKNIFEKGIEKLVDIIKQFTPEPIKELWSTLIPFFETLFEQIKEIFKKTFTEDIPSIYSKVGGKVKKDFSDFFEFVIKPMIEGFKTEGFIPAGVGEPDTSGVIGVTAGRRGTINVDSTINLTIPAGTPEEQQDFIQDTAKNVFRKEFEKHLKTVYEENPEIE